MRKCVFGFLVMLLLSATAWAQTTGSINGMITDDTGAVVPGVTITATSPALMGSQTAVSNANGLYRFPSLPPGTYNLNYQLSGFSTVNREQIIVSLGFAATVNVRMVLASVQETVTVEGASPTVDVTSPNVQTTFTAEMLKDIPNARDIWTLIGQAPGMMVTSFDVGGSRAGTQTGFSAFGSSGQVRVQIDGVNTTEGTGAAGFYYDYGSFAELQISTDGSDAQAATPGVQLNAILKSGGNQFRGNLYMDYENQGLQGRNVTDELRRVGVGEGTRIVRYRDPNVDYGGPIKRDKFWFYTSFRDQKTGVVVDGFPVENPTDFEFATILTNISYKLTWQLNDNNRLGHYIQLGRKQQPHRGAGSTAYQDSVFYQDSWSWAANVDWHSVVSSNFFFDTRWATFGYDWPDLVYGVNGELSQAGEVLSGTAFRQRATDSATGNTRGAFNPRETNRLRQQFDITGTLFKDNFLRGDHAMKFGLVTEWEQLENVDLGFMDHVSLSFNSTQGRPEFSVPNRVTLRNSPRRAVNANWHTGVFLNDQWTLARGLTANVGVRLDYYNSYYPDHEIPEGPYRDFFYGGAPLPNGYAIPASAYAGTFTIPGQGDFRKHASVAPRFGIAWDPFGHGKTVIKANWGRYYVNTGTASSGLNPAQSITYTFNWTDPSGDRAFQPNELGTFVSSSGGSTQLIDPNIRHEYGDGMSVWLEHELFRNVALRAGYTFRTDGDVSANVELQRTADRYTGLVMAADPGPDGIAGNGDDGPAFPVYDIPSALLVPSRTRTQTVDGPFQVDRAVDVAVTKRMSNNWSMTTSFLYNWDHDRGFVQNPNQERFNEQTVTVWSAKWYMTYQAPWGIVLTPVVRHQGGDNLSRNVQVTRGIDAVTGLSRNITTGTFTYEAEGPTAYREDNITIFDLRAEKRFRFAGYRELSVFVDAFNINNTNASQSTDSVVGRRTTTFNGERIDYQRFLRPTGVLPPRIFRFGFKLGF